VLFFKMGIAAAGAWAMFVDRAFGTLQKRTGALLKDPVSFVIALQILFSKKVGIHFKSLCQALEILGRRNNRKGPAAVSTLSAVNAGGYLAPNLIDGFSHFLCRLLAKPVAKSLVLLPFLVGELFNTRRVCDKTDRSS